MRSGHKSKVLHSGESGVYSAKVKVDPYYFPEKKWIVSKDGGMIEEVGKWMQQSRFHSTVNFSVPPTFKDDLIACEVSCKYGESRVAGC